MEEFKKDLNKPEIQEMVDSNIEELQNILDNVDIKEIRQKFNDMCEELRQSNINREQKKLKMNKSLPYIYISKEMVKKALHLCNSNKEIYFKGVKSSIFKEGYIEINIEDLIKVTMENEDEMYYIIQNYTGPKLGQGVRNKSNSLLRDYGLFILHFVITEGRLDKIAIYDRTGVKLSEGSLKKTIDESSLEKDCPEEVEFKLKVENNEKLEACSLEVVDEVESLYQCILITMMVLSVSVKLIEDNKDNYFINRDNLNKLIPKNSNENIQMNREIKMKLKKDNTPIYYIK